MKQIFFLITISFGISISIFSQIVTANDWYFGNYAGVKFEYGIPHGVTDGMIYTDDGCATVGDENGNLLFYSEGQTVYNRNHQVMPNGSGLMGSGSATSGAIIVPWPHSDSLFYIFTVDDIYNHLQNGLRYNIVDMSLDGGLGDIIPSKKNILLEVPVTERLVAVLHQNLIYSWVIAHRWSSDEFIAYLVTDTGLVDTPVVSAIGSAHQGGYSANSWLNGWIDAIGYIKANVTGTKIAVAIHGQYKYELFDFNSLTGVLSNSFTSPAIYDYANGVEFSPDGTKLYTTRTINPHLYQFDITQSNPFNNVVEIPLSTYQPSAVQIGPNGKLYVCEWNNPYLSVINNPNALGLACDYQSQGVYLEGRTGIRGLPTIFYYKGFKYYAGSEISDTICQGDSVLIYGNYYYSTTEIHDTINLYSWKDSIVNIYVTVVSIPSVPIIFEGSGILTSTYAANFQWYFNGNPIIGATSQNYTPTQTGNYQVEVFNSTGCSSISDNYYFIFTSIHDVEEELNSLLIYPNPSSGIFYLKNENIDEIHIVSLECQIVKTIKDVGLENNIKINFENLPKGIYILKIKQRALWKVQKICYF